MPAGQVSGLGSGTELERHPESENRRDSASVTLDTIFSKVLTPGVVHTKYVTDGPNMLNIIAIDLRAPHLHFQTARPDSLTKTTEQALAVDNPGKRVVAAINGDFFSFETHFPIGNQVVRGTFVHGTPVENRYHFAVDLDGRPFLDALSFRGAMTTGDGARFPVYGVNHTAGNAEISAYTHYFGDHTPDDAPGLELILVPESNDGDQTGSSRKTAAGMEQPMVISDIRDAGTTPIPKNGLVLRAHTTEAAERLSERISRNDEVSLYLGFDPDHTGLRDVIGGGVRILDQGEPYSGSNETRHPRTFVAIDRDTTTVFLCTVDGRQLQSIGMSYREMAAVLLKIGAWDAVNLDGGGSTTMVTRNQVANNPSDPGGEREVANSLQLISTAPPGDVQKLEISPGSFELFPGETQDLKVSAFDEFLNPVPAPENMDWQYDPETVDVTQRDDGSIAVQSGRRDTSGVITARWQEVTGSMNIRVHQFETITSDPPEIIMAPGESTEITLEGTTPDGDQRAIPLDRTQFRVSGSGIYVSESGSAYATGYDSGAISLTIGNITHEIPYTIEGDAVTTVLHDFTEDVSGWMTPMQTNRAQIRGVDPGRSHVTFEDGEGVWRLVDTAEQNEGWDIRITRQLRHELGAQLRGGYVGAIVRLDEPPGDATDPGISVQLVIRDGNGQLEAGPATKLKPGSKQLIQVKLEDENFEGYLNGDGKLTMEGNQVNGFRITSDKEPLNGTTRVIRFDKIIASPFPFDHRD